MLGQSRDREPSILARIGRPRIRGDAEQHRGSLLPFGLGLVDRCRAGKLVEKSPPVNTLFLQSGQQLDPDAGILQGDGLCHDDRGDEERTRCLRIDSREFSGQNFGQIGGCPGVVVDIEPFDDVDTVFADLDADRPPEQSSWPGAAGRWQISPDNGTALAVIAHRTGRQGWRCPCSVPRAMCW